MEALSGEFNKLKFEIRDNKKVKVAEGGRSWFEEYSAEYVNLRENYNRKKLVLDNLLQFGNSSSLTDKDTSIILIDARAKEVANLKSKLDIYETYYLNIDESNSNNITEKEGISVDTDATYAVKLNNFFDKLKTLTTELEGVSAIIDKSVSTASFANTTVIKTDNGLSVIICFVGSFVAGIVIAFIVAYIVGKSKLNKKKLNTQKPSSDKPAEESAKD